MKELLVKKVKKALDKRGYAYAEYEGGCFDIAAKRKGKTLRDAKGRFAESMLLKVLSNIDAFLTFQATSLKRLSSHLDASPMLIGTRANKGALEDGIVFERFGLPTVTVNTFEDIIEGEFPEFRSLKGGVFGEIDPQALRDARLRKHYTQEELGLRLHVSKKTVYQHERGVGLASMELIRKAESELEERITRRVSISIETDVEEGNPKNELEGNVARRLKSIGFSTFFVEKAPFDIIAEGKESVFSEVAVDGKDAKRDVKALRGISTVFGKRYFMVSEDDVDALVLSREELSSLHSIDELLRALNKKSALI